jgi:autotransporter strand-loop-strand O-heptosyltransferase
MKILIIIPHASTGGLPQVVLKRIESLIINNDVYVIEYREIAWSYVVQRNKIKNLLGTKFISLGWTDNNDIRDKFIEIVKEINPDIIHMEEIPEMFINGIIKEHTDWLYRPDRPYKIIETTHTSTFNVKQKQYFPDKFMFVSEYSKLQYKDIDIPSTVIEYPIEKLEKNQSLARKELKFDPDFFHILNVGLFTKGKNQKYLFDLAKILKEYKIHFHFVGNMAGNFQDYWEPIIKDKTDNCFIYGEREDVDLFYQASDVLIHSSTLELNPLAIKEATSYKLPIFLNNLSSYLNMYDSYKNVNYLTMDLNLDSELLLKNFNIERIEDNNTFEKLLSEEYSSILEFTQKNKNDEYIQYDINFVDGCKVEINGNTKQKFGVEILEKDQIIYKTELNVNNWCKTNTKYYKDYTVNLFFKDNLIVTKKIELEDKNVLIQLDSKSIGDTLAWFPYVEEFRKKHNCKIYCATFWNTWFENQYPHITFVNHGDKIEDLYAKYNIGWYQPLNPDLNPNDYKKQPLQKTASDILGLQYKEIVPKINIPDGARPIEDKYVCIAQYSTANTKHWHYPCRNSNKGWQILVDWLNTQGYKVMVISKQKTTLKNVLDHTGNFPIEHRINELKHCEFFIGIGSGLSWLAWAVRKKVVMISGFSNPICEFKTNMINVHNFNVCNGCFNKFQFDKGDWNWCPEHKDTDRQFECSINITPEMITDRIINTKLVENPIDFFFDKYNTDIVILESDVKVSFNKIENKFTIGYLNDDTLPISIEFKNFNTNKTYHVMGDIILSKNYHVWCIPKDKIDTDKVLVSIYEKNKILDILLEI